MFSLRQFKFIGLPFLMLLALVVQLPPSYAMSKPRLPPCVSTVQLKMGDRIFYIPRQWQVGVTFIKPGKMQDLCHPEGPIELKEWSAFISSSFLIPDFKPERGSDLSLQLRAYNETGNDNFQSLYQKVSKLMQLKKIKITDLPIEGGFRVLSTSNRPRMSLDERNKLLSLSRDFHLYSEIVYISDDPLLRSPAGEPAIFACTPYQIEQKKYERCRTNIWDGQVDFTLREFISPDIPKHKWTELYKGLLKLRNSLISNSAIKDFEIKAQ
jgi:hypothetical protein